MFRRGRPIPWRHLAWVVGAWWVAHVALVLGHVVHVFLYSVAVAPDLPVAAYSTYAERSGPWFSILFGGPVFYLLGRILRRRVAHRARLLGLAVWVLYSITDLAIVVAVVEAPTPLLMAQWSAAQGIKLLAVWWAARPQPKLRSSADAP